MVGATPAGSASASPSNSSTTARSSNPELHGPAASRAMSANRVGAPVDRAESAAVANTSWARRNCPSRASARPSARSSRPSVSRGCPARRQWSRARSNHSAALSERERVACLDTGPLRLDRGLLVHPERRGLAVMMRELGTRRRGDRREDVGDARRAAGAVRRAGSSDRSWHGPASAGRRTGRRDRDPRSTTAPRGTPPVRRAALAR